MIETSIGKMVPIMSAEDLNAEYPDDLPYPELEEHIDDLLYRFRDRNLGDTVFRVGRYLKRKLNRSDRIVGLIDPAIITEVLLF